MKLRGFAGFTLPDGAWLPPELIYMLPHLSGQHLKGLVVAIYHYTQVGGGQPLSLSDFERLTGLSRPTVIAMLKDLTGETGNLPGLLERIPEGQSFLYAPRVRAALGNATEYEERNTGASAGPAAGETQLVKNLYQFSPKTSKAALLVSQIEREKDLELKDSNLSISLNSLNSSAAEIEEKTELVARLRQAGVYLKIAQQFVEENSPAYLRKHLDYFEYALKAGLAKGPGFLVISIKENHGRPLGYKGSADLDYEYETRLAAPPADEPESADQGEPDDAGDDQPQSPAWNRMMVIGRGEMSDGLYNRLQQCRPVRWNPRTGALWVVAASPDDEELLADRIGKWAERTLIGIINRPDVHIVWTTQENWNVEAESETTLHDLP